MNKEYVKELLKDEEMVQRVSRLRTQFSPRVTEFYFFRTILEALSYLDINGDIDKNSYYNNDTLVTDCFINLYDGKNNPYISKYDPNKLNEKLVYYNRNQSEMGMIESAENLIDIFLDILE